MVQGQYTVLAEVHKTLGELECRAGNLDVAHRHTTEAVEIRLDSAGTMDGSILYPHALVAAHLGDVTATRARAEDGLRIAEQYGDRLYAASNAAVLGFLELSLGNPSAAHEWLGPAVGCMSVMGIAEAGVIPCAPDDIEALIALGQLDAAEAALEAFESAGDRPWAVASAARCRGLLLATRGDLDAARDLLGLAVKTNELVGQPLELGRTLLVMGVVERRAKQKQAARSFLDQALFIFDQVGAALWSARATAELARVGGGTAANDLTPTEERVAQLVADGRTNREVADALFVTVKTVEANLTRIFRKLGIRSRAELIRRVAVATSSLDRKELPPRA
jgi:DNA-binding CsgD family transcriptional regulator/predicted negative regulator of RcsB-dependent stress response